MHEKSDLSDIVSRCNQIQNSPYMLKNPPQELKNLRTVLERVRLLTREDVPAMVAEIKRLRLQNRKLEAENAELLSS